MRRGDAGRPCQLVGEQRPLAGEHDILRVLRVDGHSREVVLGPSQRGVCLSHRRGMNTAQGVGDPEEQPARVRDALAPHVEDLPHGRVLVLGCGRVADLAHDPRRALEVVDQVGT